MLDIPYIQAPENACALACYTMVPKHYFPEMTFEEMGEICEWTPGYVVWPFKFWQWMLARGFTIVDYDAIGYEAWAREGVEGLRRSIPAAEFQYYKDNTLNLASYTEDIRSVLAHPNFNNAQRKPTFADLTDALAAGKVCEVVLDSGTLDGDGEFSLHRVVVLDANADRVTFHDPREEPMPARKESTALFTKAWLETVSEPELCTYL